MGMRNLDLVMFSACIAYATCVTLAKGVMHIPNTNRNLVNLTQAPRCFLGKH